MCPGAGRSKEGFSVFALLDRTKSLPGRKRLKYIACFYQSDVIFSRSWFNAPYSSAELIVDRQRGVAMTVKIFAVLCE